MSCTCPTIGYGPLEVFFGAEEGVSFKAEGGTFLCPITKEECFTCIGMVEVKNQSCKFIVESLGDNKVRLKDDKGFYLRRTERRGRFPIEVQKMTPDCSCEYLVFHRNGNSIFKGDNGLFLSRIYSGLYSEMNTLESVKPEADVFCEFALDIGDLKRPVFEIISVDVNERFCLDLKTVTLKEKEFVNKSCRTENHTFKLTWEKNVTDVTTWKRAWGLNTKVSADTGYFASHFGATLVYDGLHGKTASKARTISEAEDVTVAVPPGKTMTAKLVVIMDENAEIPFAATIKKTKANGRIEKLVEHGVWKGIVCDRFGVELWKTTDLQLQQK